MLTGWGAAACGGGRLAWGFKVAKASRAAVNSLVRREITLQAESCWYSKCESSWRAVCNCCRNVNECTKRASHSSCLIFKRAGTDVALGGFGLTIGGAVIKINHVWCQLLYNKTLIYV